MGLGQHLVGLCLVVVEIIQGQGPGPRVYIVDGRRGVIAGDDRQEGAEDFLGHHVHVITDVEKQVHRHFPAIRKVFPTRIDLHDARAFLLGIPNKRRQPGIFAVIDDAGILGVFVHSGIHAPHCRGKGCFEFIQAVCRAQHIIGSNTCLPGIKHLPESDPLRRIRHGHRRADDGRRFPPQFQGNRGQVFSCRPHDVAPHLGGPGKKQVIPGLP